MLLEWSQLVLLVRLLRAASVVGRSAVPRFCMSVRLSVTSVDTSRKIVWFTSNKDLNVPVGPCIEGRGRGRGWENTEIVFGCNRKNIHKIFDNRFSTHSYNESYEITHWLSTGNSFDDLECPWTIVTHHLSLELSPELVLWNGMNIVSGKKMARVWDDSDVQVVDKFAPWVPP